MQNQKGKILKIRETPLFVLVAAAVILLDQITKLIVRKALPEGGIVPIVDGYLRLKGVRNPGGAFGLLPGSKIFLILISILIIIGVLIFYLINKPLKKSIVVAIAVIIGGAVGNLIDRILFNEVTDFIDIRFWPVFNVADIAIVAGIVIYLFAYFRDESAANVD